MIKLRYETQDLRGADCGIYGFPGRYELFVDEPADEDQPAGNDGDPRLEGNDAAELEREARRLGARTVTHWYEP